MKKITLLITAIAASTQYNHAQSNWSVGLRTGAELSKSYNTLSERRTGILMNQQLFISKRIYKHLELELNMAYKGTVTNTEFNDQIYDGPEYYASTATYNTLEAGITLRYFIIDKKGWAPYVLGGINSNKQFIRYSSMSKDRYKPLADITESKSTKNNVLAEYYVGIGLNKSIAKNWKINTQVSLAYNYNTFSFSYYPLNDYSPKVQVGLAYCW